MIDPVFFVLNLLIITSMMTFLPSVAFAMANSTDASGNMVWPVITRKMVML